ncbi:MAG TPA: adenylate/guanylate cyclase domain-containing protein [Verrucomicrobiae bacterium]|nr:adenylate/guanylate cyclase domain-containing protein [Verrucomicrobiae bacterium]
MQQEGKRELQLEIAYVLFIDIVGYSKLKTAEQHRLVELLNQIVRGSEHFRKAEANHRIVTVPSGDGMALVFYNTPEAPVECALEISNVLKEHPDLNLRMGIHSGPVSGVIDVRGHANVAGAGINMAQRVMDCGDAGHILISKHLAEDLEQYGNWKRHLHDLGEIEVKHAARVSVVNFYTEELGNPELPQKFRSARKTSLVARRNAGEGAAGLSNDFEPRETHPKSWMVPVAVVLLSALIVGGLLLSRNRAPSATDASSSLGPSSSPSLSSIPNKSVAVLPFENLSENKENAFFADGVQDEILTNLAKIADLKVISRTSVMQYKTGAPRNLREIGQQLGVAHLLEGSVQRAGNNVRVIAQLIDARNDAHLWAHTFDRDLADVFAIQTEIARNIADQLQAKISPNEKKAIEQAPTTDLAAHDLYLRAQLLYDDNADPVKAREKLPRAVRLLDEAVARDPKFLQAWCLLARVQSLIYWQGFDHTPARLELANAAAQTALRVQPDAGEAHLAFADYYYHGFRDYERARSEAAIAGRTLPNNAEVFEIVGYIDRREGRWAEATRNHERSLELDPRNFRTLQQMSLTYQIQHRYADAERIYDRALVIVPGDPATRINRARLGFDWRADLKPYQDMLATLIAEDPAVAGDVDDPDIALCEGTPAAAARTLKNLPREGVAQYGVTIPNAYYEGLVARRDGDTAKAHAAFTAARNDVAKVVEQQPDFPAAVSFLGVVDAGLGRKEEALREGRRGCELLPISKDAIDGGILAVNLAQIYSWVGEKDLAIEQLGRVVKVPNQLSYGMLKLHPMWDSLRGDPRFEKLLASLAPK